MKHHYQELNWQEADDLLAAGNVLVLDVRSEDSFQTAHIPGAIHLNMRSLADFCKRSDREEQAVLVYCYHGISSQSVAQHLIQNGFRQVYSLKGGFEEWSTQHSKTQATSE
ncbi:MAG TPA: thiosulfate sulfurtransferase GlpE [Coxiellaceae bacterium]|nr:thiosulfate sulfurtransferase GlpE [Coxiellaceae bacterium]